MTKTQVEVITSVQRRRRWSRAEKEQIVAAAMEPGAVASEVARAAGIHTSQLFRWRHQLCERAQAAAAFSPVAIAAKPGRCSKRQALPPFRACCGSLPISTFELATALAPRWPRPDDKVRRDQVNGLAISLCLWSG